MRPARRGFTLLEVLVVVVILAALAALLFPAVEGALDQGRTTACLSNLRQIGAGITAYAGDNDGRIPFGPKGDTAYNFLTNFYPSTGAPTSLLSLHDGSPVGLGLLLGRYLEKNPQVLFCPGSDQRLSAAKELAKVGKEQAQGSYYYRHGSNPQLFDDPRNPPAEPPLRLGALGDNRQGKPIRALVIDSIFLPPKGLENLGIDTLSSHRQKVANVLFADGHVRTLVNRDGPYTVDVQEMAQIRNAFSKILDVLEKADEAP